MEEDSRVGGMVKAGLGAVGLGAVAAVITVPGNLRLWVALAILVLFLVLIGGYFLWRRVRARRQSRMFSSAVEAQTAAAPKSISDPNQRAALDKLRQKFQTGMQEFKNRGKDIYKLPWHVIIGESGSGKTEAIRHSGIEFPPGLQDELQGTGGTVNMDWWFTNRAIILDTAGSMIFRDTGAGDSPEWKEFLRLLKKSRPQCPINGLFLVLSIESLIKDSADKIAEKASKLAQQLDLIQRTLDVRFPVYLLITKADLLTGFREFFDNIDDPLLQHQMFGWSNPEPLDSHFRPDLIETHLKSVADRLRRRRLALLLRDSSSSSMGRLGGDTAFLAASAQGRASQRRLDELDALFALPESVMRLVPRLRRYLETVFVAGEWSSKPVFLRGVYFTSSMREGKALDEAIATATGLSVDQLPEDRSWDKNRAFFLRDLFVDKVFRESGLVTRATNTVQLLRKRQFAIFGTAGAALLLLIVLAVFGRANLKDTVQKEAEAWRPGASNWNHGVWSPPIVRIEGEGVIVYAGTDLEIKVGDEKLSVVQYHQRLKELVSRPLAMSWIFKPLSWIRLSQVTDKDRKMAQRILLEHGVLKPLLVQTRNKMQAGKLDPTDSKAVQRHREALFALIRFQTDKFSINSGNLNDTNSAAKYLKSLVSYLIDSDTSPVDTNLVGTLAWTYSKEGSGDGTWPPDFLRGADSLSNNLAIKEGLAGVRRANQLNKVRIEKVELPGVNELVDDLEAYRLLEKEWLNNTNTGDRCRTLVDLLVPASDKAQARLRALGAAADIPKPLTNLSEAYQQLADAAVRLSALSFSNITAELSDAMKTESTGLVAEIRKQLSEFNREQAETITEARQARSPVFAGLNSNYLAVASDDPTPAFELRSSLYLKACRLATEKAEPDDSSLGDGWTKFQRLTNNAADFEKKLSDYSGPLAKQVREVCEQIAGDAKRQLKSSYLAKYVELATRTLRKTADDVCDFADVGKAKLLFDRVSKDLDESGNLGDQKTKLEVVRTELSAAQKQAAANYAACASQEIKAQLKFPVVLDSSEALDEAGLKRVKRLLSELSTNLAASAWTAIPGSDEFLNPLRTNTWTRLVGALLSEKGMSEVSIFFTQPKPASSESNPYYGELRYAKVYLSGAEKEKIDKNLSGLSRDVVHELVKLPINSGVRLDFFSDVDRKTKTASFEMSDWALLRLIKEHNAEQVEGKGTEWKLKLRVKVNGADQTLDAFSIHLTLPLPRRDDWPQ